MNLPKTWFIDFDGTLVHHTSHKSNEDFILDGTKQFFEENVKEEDVVIITTAREHFHKERIEKFLEKHKIKYDLVLCGLNSGARILINDKKPDGTITAYAYNLDRDKGIEFKI